MLNKKPHLTPAEIKVLTLISSGLSSKDAATKLIVSKRTVDFHLRNIYEKLQVHNRVQAIHIAHQFGLISLEEIFPHN